jgi:hypothetical protein
MKPPRPTPWLVMGALVAVGISLGILDAFRARRHPDRP